MPVISSDYTAKGLFKNGHYATIYSAKLRPKIKLAFNRERLHLPDGDFLDLDWIPSLTSTKKLTIQLHGLEGNAQRIYMHGQAKYLIENGWDVLNVNYRGCSGEPNVHFYSYNAGKTEDLKTIISTVIQKDRYVEIALIGFSLGGNLMLKYLGEGNTLPKQLTKGIAISSPLSLKGSLDALNRGENWVYRTTFLNHLRKKYRTKVRHFPNQATMNDLRKMKSLLDFDNIYTAPAHGFVDAYDYYEKNSCLQFLNNIDRKILILNAKNDSFLSPQCYPFELASSTKNIYLETPQHGGHVGFYTSNRLYFSEKRALEFLNE